MTGLMHSVIASSLVFASAPVLAQEAPTHDTAQSVETKPSTLDLRISPLMDLVMLVRTLAEGENAAIPEIKGLAGAVEAARQAQKALGESSGWGVFLGPSSAAESAAEMLAICRELPERFTTRSGTSLEPRSLGTGVAESLVEAEPAFMAELWPARRTELERIRADLLGKLKPKEKEVYAFVQSTLGIADPQPVLPVYLVADAPWPGAMTYLSRRGGVCFVGITSDGASQLLETVLHETLHALDASSSGPDVFDELRTALRGAGVEPTDARLRDLPHMVMFVHAAETVRRLLDPDHIDYGTLEIGGRPALYIRDQASFNAVQPVWRAYLDGGIDRQEAVRRIVAAAACAPAIEE